MVILDKIDLFIPSPKNSDDLNYLQKIYKFNMNQHYYPD